MNSFLYKILDTELNECVLESDTTTMEISARKESYATTPMMAVKLTNESEEDIHTAFEAAISGRLLAMRERMNRISGPLPSSRRYKMERLPPVKGVLKQRNAQRGAFARAVLLSCYGLTLALLGFDLMGILILCAR